MKKQKSQKRGSWSTILLVVLLLLGLSLLLYPTVSDYWNSFTQSRAVTTYAEQLENLDTEQYEQLWAEARAYNEELAAMQNGLALPDAMMERYNRLLSVDDSGILGVVEIPSIGVNLPIYHGTSDAVLQVAIGHVDWSSLPTGGESTHCVISGHRGLPSAKLFTHLDQLQLGDLFMMQVLDQVLTYEVDQILIVEPHEVNSLLVTEGKDYCSLVTCTPYGVNSHRLLVRGHRTENLEVAETVRITSDAAVIDPMIVAPMVAIPILLVLLIHLMLPKKPKRKAGENPDETP